MSKRSKPSLKRSLKGVRRKTVRISKDTILETGFLEDHPDLPLVYRPRTTDLSLAKWVEENRREIEENLLKYGAILFRGFRISSPEAFRDFCTALCPELLTYVEQAAPRGQIAQHVYNTTEYPADQWIPLHHEMSYSHNWPTKIFFYCQQPAAKDGYTPFASDRKIFKLLPDDIKQPFLEKGVMYVRNYGEGVDLPWQTVFQTENKKEVEAYLKKTQTEFEWFDGGRLRTKAKRQVLATHPVTGDTLWFNHAHMFHISNMPESVRNALCSEFSDEELPRNSFYGDGSPIPDEVAETIRNIYKDNALFIPWLQGDILLLDNFLMSHGRSPYEGDRLICVAMAELYTNPDFV